MQIVESTLRPRGLVRLENEVVQGTESHIRKLASAGLALVKVINEKLQPYWGVALLKIINENVSLVETKFRILTSGAISAIVRVVNESVSLIEGPFTGLFNLIQIIAEAVQSVETRLKVLAQGLIKVINESVSLVESPLKYLGKNLLKVINNAVSLVEASPIRSTIAAAAKKLYTGALRTIHKIFRRSR